MATSTIQTDDNNDIYLPDGQNISIVSDGPACSQDIIQATLMRLGEDVYDVDSGVDYLGSIFSPQPDVEAARDSISAAILGSPDTVSVDQLVVEISSNSFNYVALVNTIYGPLKVSQ